MIIVGAYDAKAEYVTSVMCIEERDIARSGEALAKSCAAANVRPDEFELWQLGEFEPADGKIKPKRKTLYDGIELMKMYKEGVENEKMLQRMESAEDNPS